MRENLDYINGLTLHCIKRWAMMAVIIGYSPFLAALVWSEVIK